MADYDKAKESLVLTIRQLKRLNPSVAASLREGMEETLTLHKLEIAGLLRKTLSTTNPIESCFSIKRTITGRSKYGSVLGISSALKGREEVQAHTWL